LIAYAILGSIELSKDTVFSKILPAFMELYSKGKDRQYTIDYAHKINEYLKGALKEISKVP
jgi:hypothetical protein